MTTPQVKNAKKPKPPKTTKAIEWFDGLRIDEHLSQWPLSFENSVNWTDDLVIDYAQDVDGWPEIVIILYRDRHATRTPYAIQMPTEQATEMVSDFEALLNTENPPRHVAFILANARNKRLAGIKMDYSYALNTMRLLWGAVSHAVDIEKTMQGVH